MVEATLKTLTGGTRLGPQSDIKGKEKYPALHIAYSDAETLFQMGGQTFAELKPNFNLRRVVVCQEKFMYGAISFRPLAENGWRTHGRENFPSKSAGCEIGDTGIAPLK